MKQKIWVCTEIAQSELFVNLKNFEAVQGADAREEALIDVVDMSWFEKNKNSLAPQQRDQRPIVIILKEGERLGEKVHQVPVFPFPEMSGAEALEVFLYGLELISHTPVEVETKKNLSSKMNDLLIKSLTDLQKIKKVHRQLAPLRVDKKKGMSVAFKYAAGEASGGEFFDIIDLKNSFLLVVSHSRSYIATSILISHLEKLKNYEQLGDVEMVSFIDQLSKEILSLGGAEDLKKTSLFLLLVHHHQLKVSGYHLGKFQMLTSEGDFVGENQYYLDSSFCEQSRIEFDLKRGEVGFLISPGLRENIDDKIEGEPLISYLKKNINNKTEDIVDEIFIHCRKDRDDDFLKTDATLIRIEVDGNVMQEI